MKEEEVDRQRGRILRARQVVRDGEYPFSEDVFVDSSGAVDVSFPVPAKVSVLIETLCLRGSCALIHQPWSQFTLVAGRVNVGVTWSRDEVLVSAFFVPGFASSSGVLIVVLLLVNHPRRHVSPYPE